jgi:hypothetical protein
VRYRRRLATFDPRPQRVVERYAVSMPDGSPEVCLFCSGTTGKPKVVFDDRVDAERCAAELSALPTARSHQRVHPCRIWSGVYHLTSQPYRAEAS